jgi:hypothetical protein
MEAIEAALPRDFGDDRQVEFVKQYLIDLNATQADMYRGRRIHRSNPQGREARRPAGRAVHTKFEFVINQQTARALGLDVPNSIQLLADQLIE